MGLLDMIFSKISPSENQRYSENGVAVISEKARRGVEAVNESLRLANDSSNLEIKLSRLGMASQKFSEVKKMALAYPFLNLAAMDEVERDIERLLLEFETAGYRAIIDGNARGEKLENAGKTDEAIAQFEKLLEQKVNTPFTYKRLAIIYNIKKQQQDELRVLQAALNYVPSSNETHYLWFQERLEKLESTLGVINA